MTQSRAFPCPYPGLRPFEFDEAPLFFGREKHIAGMLVGILVFVLGYTAIECTRYYHQIITLAHVHRTVLVWLMANKAAW